MSQVKLQYVGGFGEMVWSIIDGNLHKRIGNEGGFAIVFDDPGAVQGGTRLGVVALDHNPQVVRPLDHGPQTVQYQLITPWHGPKEDRVPALLFKRTERDLVVLGRVTLPHQKLAGWAENLLNQDLAQAKSGISDADPMLGLVRSLNHADRVRTGEALAAGVLAKVEEVAQSGLHKVYGSHNDYLYDLFPDFCWDEEGLKAGLAWIVEQPRLKAASDVIMARGGPDYLAMFQDSLTGADEGIAERDGAKYLIKKDPRWGTRL